MKSDVTVRVEWHNATLDSDEINRSTARATCEPEFRDIAIELVDGLKFPAFKYQIVEHVNSSTNCSDYIALFQTLNPSIQYDDKEQIRAAFEVNIPRIDGADLAIPGRREIVSVPAGEHKRKRIDQPVALIQRYIEGHPKNAYTAAEIDALVHPNGTGRFSVVMTSLELRKLVHNDVLDFKTIETIDGREDSFSLKVAKVR